MTRVLSLRPSLTPGVYLLAVDVDGRRADVAVVAKFSRDDGYLRRLLKVAERSIAVRARLRRA